jgi:hypothetical protein
MFGPAMAGFRLYANLGVLNMSSLCLLCAFLKLLTVFDLFFTPGTMFQALTVLEKKFFNFKGSAAFLVVIDGVIRPRH